MHGQSFCSKGRSHALGWLKEAAGIQALLITPKLHEDTMREEDQEGARRAGGVGSGAARVHEGTQRGGAGGKRGGGWGQAGGGREVQKASSRHDQGAIEEMHRTH